MPTTKCRVFWDLKGNFYRVTTPYKAGFKEAMNALIPAAQRHPEYNKDGSFNCWILTEAYGEAMVKVCSKLWGSAEVQFQSKKLVEAEAAAKNDITSASGAARIEDVVQQFFQLLPYSAARSAYRAAAVELHPDKFNGDSSKMSKLNLTWRRIEQEVYKR